MYKFLLLAVFVIYGVNSDRVYETECPAVDTPMEEFDINRVRI